MSVNNTGMVCSLFFAEFVRWESKTSNGLPRHRDTRHSAPARMFRNVVFHLNDIALKHELLEIIGYCRCIGFIFS